MNAILAGGKLIAVVCLKFNPFMPTVAFNICCPRDCVSRHNGGASGAPLKPLRDDSALRALLSESTFMPTTVGMNGLNPSCLTTPSNYTPYS